MRGLFDQFSGAMRARWSYGSAAASQDDFLPHTVLRGPNAVVVGMALTNVVSLDTSWFEVPILPSLNLPAHCDVKRHVQ